MKICDTERGSRADEWGNEEVKKRWKEESPISSRLRNGLEMRHSHPNRFPEGNERRGGGEGRGGGPRDLRWKVSDGTHAKVNNNARMG